MLALYVAIKNWFTSEEGQDLIEYALIIALMIVIAVLGLITLGGKVSGLWNQIASWLSIGTIPSI